MSMRQLAMRCIGRSVCVHSRYGVHYGVLHHVDDNGIYLQQTRRGQLVSDSVGQNDVTCLGDAVDSAEMSEAWFPFLFLPWIALWGLYPWGWYW